MNSTDVTRCAEIISILCSVLDLTHPEKSRRLRLLCARFCVDIRRKSYMEMYMFLRDLWMESELAGMAFCALPSWDSSSKIIHETDVKLVDALYDEFVMMARKDMN